jgi:hypothetical protein
MMNEKWSCYDEEHTWWATAPVFYDACFLLNKADLCPSFGRPFASLEDSCAVWYL